MRTIKCQICGKEVEATSPRQKYCPECAKGRAAARSRKWYQNNKEKVAAQHKEYRENNKEKVLAYCREYHWNHREQVLARHKEWRENNKEHIKEYYENNKVLSDREGNNFCVYIHTDPLGKVYIGRAVGDDVKTVNRQRWGGGSGYKQCPRFWEAIQEFGWNNIQHELLERGLTYEQVLERERYWIERCNSRDPKHGYNIV